MFISRTKFEKEIKKAEKRGERREQEKVNMQNSFNELNQSMWSQFDRTNMVVDKLIDRVDRLENKRCEKK